MKRITVLSLITATFGPPPPPPPAHDKAVSRMAQSYWVNFAWSGGPNRTGLPGSGKRADFWGSFRFWCRIGSTTNESNRQIYSQLPTQPQDCGS